MLIQRPVYTEENYSPVECNRGQNMRAISTSVKCEMLLLWKEAERTAGMEEDNRFLIG